MYLCILLRSSFGEKKNGIKVMKGPTECSCEQSASSNTCVHSMLLLSHTELLRAV